MANIKNMAMAEEIIANKNIETKKTLFGLSTAFVYTPTGSRVKGYQNEYGLDKAPIIKDIINANEVSSSEIAIKAGKVATAPNGPIRLDIAASDDRKFAAIQMSRFEDFSYKPVSDVKIFLGEDVGAVLDALL